MKCWTIPKSRVACSTPAMPLSFAMRGMAGWRGSPKRTLGVHPCRDVGTADSAMPRTGPNRASPAPNQGACQRQVSSPAGQALATAGSAGLYIDRPMDVAGSYAAARYGWLEAAMWDCRGEDD